MFYYTNGTTGDSWNAQASDAIEERVEQWQILKILTVKGRNKPLIFDNLSLFLRHL